jgi:hypothetical protein
MKESEDNADRHQGKDAAATVATGRRWKQRSLRLEVTVASAVVRDGSGI